MPNRSLSPRLLSILLCVVLLAAFAAPVLAQEGPPPTAPLTVLSVSEAKGGSCAPLAKDEQATFGKLAQLKEAGQLDGADYELFLKLSEQDGCAANTDAPDGISAVTGYTFASSSGTYTALSGGTTPTGWTITADDQSYNALAIGFTFNYNGADYTQFSIQNNGFIAMGATVSTSYLPISGGSSNNVISALGRDLVAQTGANLSYLTSGAAPNRVLTVEWLNYKKYLGTGDSLSFQIILHETSNVIEFVYGGFTIGTANTTYPQVGLRGGSNADFNNRKTTTDWSASAAGTLNTDTMTLTSAIKPASGQTYTWTPPSGPPGCAVSPSPADLATNVAISTSLGWSAGVGGLPTSYDVYFGTGSTPPFVANVAASPYNPGALAYSTLYYWQIVPKNASGSATGCSIWSFTTKADPTVTPPWLEPFTSYPPTNWTEATGLLANPTTLSGTSSAWTADGFANVGTTGSARLNIWSTTVKEWMFTPPVNLGSGMGYQLEFDLALTPYSGTGTATLGSDDKFAVVISTDGGVTWTSTNILQQWNSGTPISNTGDHITLNLASYSGIVMFGFYGESTVSNADNKLFVDNVQVRQPPSGPPNCAVSPSPADLATGVSINTNLAWSAGLGGGTPTSYDVYFGTGSTPPFVANVAASPYNPGALAYSTLYYWQIVPKNASGSATGCPIWSFTTMADPTVGVFPYSQDFNGASFPGWALENSNADANIWGVGTTYRRGSSGGAAIIYYNATLAMNDWLFTPPLQLVGGTTYGVRFFYRGSGTTFPEKMEVKWGSAASSAGMTNGPIFDDPNINFSTMKEVIATFTPATSGIYYVGFHGYSAPDMNYLVVDDVTIYNTADSIWQWQGGTSADFGTNANWEGAIVPGALDTVEIPVVVLDTPAASAPVVGSYSEVSYGPVNNLTIDVGATLVLLPTHSLKVDGTLTNNGSFGQTKYVSAATLTSFLNIKNSAGATDKYFGVNITADAAMGDTTVTIRGNQTCGTAGTLGATVKRCYDITPTTAQNATVRFYYDAGTEANGNTTPIAYHYSGAGNWDALTSTQGGSGIGAYTEATGVNSYSPFALKDDLPNAVALRTFGAAAALPATLPAALPLAAVLAGLAGAVLLRRRRA